MAELGWLYATSEEADLRNGAQALALAQRAVELTGGKEPTGLVALDAAFAELGRWDEALATAAKVKELAQANGLAQIAAAAESRMALYRSRKAFREQSATQQ